MGKNFRPPLEKILGAPLRSCTHLPKIVHWFFGYLQQSTCHVSIHTYIQHYPSTDLDTFIWHRVYEQSREAMELTAQLCVQPVSWAVYAVPGVDGGVGLHGSAPPRSPGSLPAAPSGLGTGGERLTVSVGTATFTADDCCSAGIPTADRGGPRGGGDSGHLPNTYQSLGANISCGPRNPSLDSLAPLAEVDFLSGFRAPRDGSGPRKTVQGRGRNQGPP